MECFWWKNDGKEQILVYEWRKNGGYWVDIEDIGQCLHGSENQKKKYKLKKTRNTQRNTEIGMKYGVFWCQNDGQDGVLSYKWRKNGGYWVNMGDIGQYKHGNVK
jgi:hypothetical protein